MSFNDPDNLWLCAIESKDELQGVAGYQIFRSTAGPPPVPRCEKFFGPFTLAEYPEAGRLKRWVFYNRIAALALLEGTPLGERCLAMK